MNRSFAVFTLLTASAFASVPASASYFAECDLEITVLTVSEAVAESRGNQATFHVDRVLGGSGHSTTHCKDYPSKEHFKGLLLAGDGDAQVVPGARLRVKYWYANGRSPTGISESTRWTVQGVAVDEAPTTPAALLSIASACAADPSTEACALLDGPLLVGLTGASVVHWDVQEIGGCGGDGRFAAAKGLVISKVDDRTIIPSSTVPFKVPVDGEPKEKLLRATAWKAIAGVASEGTTPFHNLVGKVHEQPAGIRAHAPIAELTGALTGAKLVLGTLNDADSTLPLSLVRDGRTTSMGTVAVPMVKQYDAEASEQAGKDVWANVPARFGSIREVGLVRTRFGASIVAAISLHEGGHCTPEMVRWIAAPLP